MATHTRTVIASAAFASAIVTLPTQRGTSDNPATVSYVSATAAGNKFYNTGREHVWLTNSGASPVMVTFLARRTCNHGFLHNAVNRINNGQTAMLGPFDISRFNDATGYVTLSYSTATDMHVAVTG